MFQDYTELRNLYREKKEPILILINNEDIVIDGKSIFYPKGVEKGIFTAQDILYDYGKYLSFYAFQGKYSLKCNFLGYLQVLPAIPKYLLEKARSQPYSETRNNLSNAIFQFSSSVTKDVNSSKIEPSGIKKWENDLNLVDFNWKLAFTRISKTCKETKLREFHYKLLHRIIHTKKELYRYGRY